MRRLLASAVGLAVLVAAGLLAYAYWRGDDVGASLAAMDLRVLPLALALHVLAHLFWALRYSLLAQPFGLPVGPWRAWRIVTAGVFGGAVTPGRIGGEALKMTILVRGGASGSQASRLLLVDRSVDLLFFAGTGVAAAAVLPAAFAGEGRAAQVYAITGTAVLGGFLVLLAAVLWSPGLVSAGAAGVVRVWDRLRRREARDKRLAVRGFLAELRTGVVSSYRDRPGRMALAMALTACNWIAEYAVLWVLLGAFGIHIPYPTVFLVGTVLTLVANIPVTPGGTGVAEVSALALFGALDGRVTVLLPVAWRGVTYLYDLLVGGAVAAWTLPTRQVSELAVAQHPVRGEET